MKVLDIGSVVADTAKVTAMPAESVENGWLDPAFVATIAALLVLATVAYFICRRRIHSVARWLDRPVGRNALNVFLFAVTALAAYGLLRRYAPTKLLSPVGAFLVGLPLAGLLFSLRSLIGPKISFRIRHWWRKLLDDSASKDASDLGLTDRPIARPKEDKLGFSRYAAILAHRIIDPQGDNAIFAPLVVSVDLDRITRYGRVGRAMNVTAR